MDEHVCASCEARNPEGASHCWQCYARFGGSPTPGPSIIRGLNPQAAYALEGPATLPATPSFPWLTPGLVIRFALVIALAGGGWWGWKTFFGGFDFPDQVAGAPRLDTSETEAMSDIAEAVFGAVNIRSEVSYYGSDPLAPMFAVATIDFPDDPVDAVLAGGRATDFITDIDLTQYDFECFDSGVGEFRSGCIWPLSEESLALVSSAEKSSVEFEPIARKIKAQTD
jgi:hypothetical protein